MHKGGKVGIGGRDRSYILGPVHPAGGDLFVVVQPDRDASPIVASGRRESLYQRKSSLLFLMRWVRTRDRGTKGLLTGDQLERRQRTARQLGLDAHMAQEDSENAVDGWAGEGPLPKTTPCDRDWGTHFISVVSRGQPPRRSVSA